MLSCNSTSTSIASLQRIQLQPNKHSSCNTVTTSIVIPKELQLQLCRINFKNLGH
jgi:hypothetical protein